MPDRTFTGVLLSLFLSLLVAAFETSAAQRTFVSSSGDDTKPCSLVLPCRSFAAALLLTDTNGEIIVVNSAGYGSVTVDKAVSIIAPPGIYAGISAMFSPGVNVTAASGSVVLRNLTIVGISSFNGVVYAGNAQLLLDGVSITSFVQYGIFVFQGGAQSLTMRNSIIAGNDVGISALSGGPGHLMINVSGSVFAGNGTAFDLKHNVSVYVTDSTITGGGIAINLHSDNASYVECVRCAINNTGNVAIRADLDFGAAEAVIVLSGSSITDGVAEAIVASNGAIVRASDTTITRNATGISPPTGGGQVISWGNNRLFGNGTDGSFTSVAPMQ